MRRLLHGNLIFVGAAVLLAVLGVSLFMEGRRNARISKVLDGPIRGNRESHIFHVPTCPQYNSIAGGNIRLFESVVDAEAAGYHRSLNCLDAVDVRVANENEGSDAQVSYEDPRQ